MNFPFTIPRLQKPVTNYRIIRNNFISVTVFQATIVLFRYPYPDPTTHDVALKAPVEAYSTTLINKAEKFERAYF